MAKAATNSLYGAVEIIPESIGCWNNTWSAARVMACMHHGIAQWKTRQENGGVTSGNKNVGPTLYENSREEQASGEVAKSNCWMHSSGFC